MNNFTFEEDNKKSPNQDHVKIGKLIIVCIYGCLSIGILFNCSVVVTVLNVFRNLKRHRSTNKHTFVYILALSCVDALILINLPFIVTDMMSGWVFGTVLCKFHSTSDSVNKVLSTFILTALSFDRYLVVCYPHRFQFWRTIKVTAAVLAGCITAAAVLLSPYYLYTEVSALIVLPRNITVVKCYLSWDNPTQAQSYMYVIFGIGFCIPLILMTFFYTSIILHMWKSSRKTGRQRRSYTRKVTQRTSILVIFYFLCWTPYWILHFSSFYISSLGIEKDWIPKLFLLAHILAYLNSAVNPLLYALLNRELRRQCFMTTTKYKNGGRSCEAVEIHNIASDVRSMCCQTSPLKSQ